jgi:hypothetical protein
MNDIDNWTPLPDGTYDHDCAGDGAPGLEPGPVLTATAHGDQVVFVAEDCRACGKVWWLIDGTYYDPNEWDGGVSEIMERSQS